MSETNEGTEKKKGKRTKADTPPDPFGPTASALPAKIAYPLAILCGLLYFLAFPGIDLWPLSFVALVPLIVALRGQSPRRALGLGWLAGFTMTMTGFYWLMEMLKVFSGFPVPLCLLFMAILCGYQAGRMLVSNAGQMPFLIGNAEGGSMALDEWYRPYAAKDMPGVKLCFVFTHDVATLHSKKEIRSPDQIKGMKIRPAHAAMSNWMTSLGATTVQVSAPESREALERGVADAITFPWGSLMNFKIDGIAKFHIDEPMYVATFATIINQDRYNALNAQQKKVLDEHCSAQTAGQVGRDWAKWEDDGRQKLKAPGSGHTVVKLRPEELAAWKKSAAASGASWPNIRMSPSATRASAEFPSVAACSSCSRTRTMSRSASSSPACHAWKNQYAASPTSSAVGPTSASMMLTITLSVCRSERYSLIMWCQSSRSTFETFAKP